MSDRRRNLRVPASLVVAFLGTAGYVGLTYGGCHMTTDPAPDAGYLPNLRDAAGDALRDGDLADSDPTPDAPRDAGVPDTPVI